MKKMWKRFVSLLLACTLLAGMLPLSASAAEKPTNNKWVQEKVEALNAELGDESHQYELDGWAPIPGSDLFAGFYTRSYFTADEGKVSTTVMFIAPGDGGSNFAMPDYSQVGDLWVDSGSVALYIANGVTEIGNHAFDGMSTLETIEFENSKSLTKVGEYAFNNCDKMVGLSLDLSNVTTLGKYAFNGCERLGSGENNKGVTLNDALTTIPENAFNTCGLKNVNIPKSCTKIEKNAFAHNSLSEVGELVLPDGLVTIGDSAFVVTMGSGETGIGITSLTIPSSVKSIGANAFSGRRNLAEVTVEDDNNPGTTLTLGDHAFGYNESSAFSEWGSITDDRTGQKYEGTMGTKFYLPADLTEKFINGTNCYTGDIEPMKWVKTQQPTCDTDGYHLYETTKKGAYDDEGKPLVLQYKYTIPMLGHDYQLKKSFSATCETNSYELWVCTRDETHTENRKIGEVSKPKGHNYQLTQVDDTEMGGGNDTTFTWVCQTKEHDDTRDSLDKTLEITIEPATIQANTSMTVGDLADMMPQVDGGKLSLAEDEKLDAALTTDTKPVRVVFTPDEVKYADYTNVGAVSEFNNADLTLEVNVSKAKLDFSSVRFGNCLVGINPGEEVNVPITIERGNLPEDVKAGAPVYTEHGNKEGSTTPPSIGKSWTGTVSVTFTYDPKKYEEETKNLPAEYTYSQDPEAGTVKITHSYVVTKLEMTNVSATAIPDLEYTGSPMETVHVYGIPAGSTVFWEWVSTTDSSVTSMGSAENGNSPNLQIAEITNAGTYEVTITITNKSYETYTLPSPVTVTIQKAKIETPKPQKDLVYTSHKLIGLASPDANAKYSYQEGSKLVGVNAGTYTAMAVLTDTANYEWTESDDDGDGAVTISWNIAKRPVIETSIGNAYKDQTTPFTGNPITAVSPPSSTSSGFFDVTYDDEGNLVGKIKGTETVAFKISHAQETNAETYTVIASIEDFANFCWQNHPDDEDVTLGTWTIGKLQIYPPTIAAPDATYDGVPYDGEVTLKHSSVSGSNGSSEGIIDLNETNILYYTQPTGGTGGSAPVNAGTYFAGVESNGWAFVDGKLATNYQILGGSRALFSISKAIATMEFSQKEVSATYTAQGTDLQQVTVDGLVDADKDKPASDVYTVTYTYKYRNDNTDWEDVRETITIEDPDTFVFTDVGQYQITATWGTGTVSNNYTADPDTYTLTIEKAEDQSITLTPDEEERWTEAIDQTPAKYTITYGEAATFKVTGTAALDNASISYAVKDDSEKGHDGASANVLTVGSDGKVTIHQAGTATITVTAADTDNVTGTSVNYTVTVNRAEPKLELNEGHAAYTGSEVAEDTYKKATLSGAGEGYAHPDGTKLAYYFYEYNANSQNTVLEDTENGNALQKAPSSVGDYWLKVVFPGDACYSEAATAAKFTITPAELSVSATGHTGTYDGKTYPAITIKSVKGNGTTLAQGQYTVKYAKTNTNIAPGADADVWQNLLTVKDVADSSSDKLYYWYMVTADNYNPAIGKVEVKITPAPLTVTGEPASYEKEYDGNKAVDEALTDITVTAKDVPDVTISVAATGTYADKNAGEGKDVTLTLTLSLSGTDGANIDWGNYSYNGAAPTDGKITLTKTGAGTINPKAITVTGISAENRVYDGTKVVQLTGTPETTDKVGEDNLTLALASNATGSIESADVGNDKAVTVETSVITLGGDDANNYKVSAVKDAANGDVKVNITQRPVNLEFAGIGQDGRIIEKAYTGQPVNVTVGPVASPAEGTGFIDSDQLKAGDVDYTYMPVDPTTDTDHTAVGSYTVTAALKADPTGNYDNYELKFPDAATLKITPAEMVVDAQSYTGTYTGKAHNVTDSWTAETTDSASTEIEITKVEFIKKTDDTRPEAGAEGWDEIPFINVAQSGEYWYKVTAENYAPIVGDSAVTITINPATLTLSSDLTEEKEYDGTTEAEVTGETVTGAQNGESITVSSVSAAYDNANVGTGKTITTTYEVTFGAGVTPGNYTYTGNVEGKATSTWTIKTTVEDGKITQAPVTVTISDQTSVYDGEKPTVGQEEGTKEDPKAWYVSTGEVFSQDTTKDNLGITLSIAPDSKDADTYAITGEWTNKNYDVTFAGNWTGEEHKGEAGIYTITPRPISVQIGNAEGFYGDEPVKPSGLLEDISTEDGEGLVEGDSPDQFLDHVVINASPNTDVGSHYTITGTSGEYGNYNVTFASGTYTVKQRPITITIADHSSKYGAEIDGGIADPVSDKNYTVAITGNATTGDAIVNNDVLTVTLETTASAKAAAGTYDITGSAEGNKVNNYAITWAGNGGDRDDGGKNGKYTIEQAELAISFEKGNQVPNGVSINITDSYKDNPLVLKNDTTKTEVSTKDKKTLTIKYSIGLANGGTGDVSDIATIDETTGEVTIHSTGTVRVTAKVTANEGSNYTGTQTTWYELNIISGGQMALNVTPATGLKYTGEAQNLLAREASCTVAGAEIQYSLDNQDWGDEIPTGTNAGTYTVYVKATDPSDQYSDVTEHVTVTIDKADLKGRFAQEEYTHVLTTGTSYDSANKNPLTITSQNYKANPANYTYYSDNMKVASSANGTSTIVITGTAGESATIRVTVPGDNNYNEGTFTYTLEISDKLSEIKYNVTGTATTYNGQPQTIAVKVTSPASGATVRYWNEETKAYDLSEPPAYTDVQDSGTTIKFQITAPGYNTVTGEATLTINPKPIKENMIAGIAESYTYTGKGITFDDAISVHDEGVLLTKDTDYTITYGNNTAVGIGSVTITGTGNYKESVTKNFTISPVDASDLTASLDRTFGYYGDSETNNATVTVTHGSHTVDSSEIELTVTRQDSTIESGDVVQEGLKLTFNKAGIYTIHVVVSGTHKGAFDLTYTLLPQDVASDDFQVATDPVDRVWTYDGGNHAFGVTVTSGGTPLQKDVDFTLRYTYLPYVGSQEEREYDPESTEFTEAGIYTVIVEGTGNYTGHAELVALIQPRDLSDAGITAAFTQTGLVYNGEAQEPGVTLTYNGTAITQLKDTEYYGNTNAGEAQALSAAREDCNNFTGARVDAFTIEKKSLKDSTITAKADPEEYYYTGYPVTPAVTVTDSGRNVDLSIGADYTVTSDAVGPGKVNATVTGTGNYTDMVTVEFTILPTGAEPVETLDLTVTPSEWTWNNGQTKAAISVTFNGKELNDADYELTVSKDGETPKTVTKAEAVELLSAPGKYTITATGVGAYNGSTDTETVTIQKIQPEVTVTATPNSLSGGGKVTLTLKGEKLPAFAEGQDLSSLLTASAKDEKNAPDLSELEWETDEQTGVMTAELTLPNTNETYTFTLTFTGNEYYEAATASEQVVVAQQIISGGGGGPVEDQPADPDDTGVSDWLNTKDHLAYLAGYPGGTFGPDQNMTRAEAAQMFYNLLLEKDVKITVEFEDVPADAWYAKPVNTLASLGILSGVGNGRFDPERSITRAEFTVIAMKFANTSGGGVNIFSDVNEDDWFYSAVVDSTQYGWINGYPDGTFRPEATISRAEVTVIVNHMLGRAADRPYVIAHEEELNTFGDVNRGHWGYFHVAEATNAHEYHTEDGTESWTGLS